MLIKFTVENCFSFKEETTLDMIASSVSQHKDTNILNALNYNLLKSIAIFGANASGKSNLFKAMKFAKDFVLKSSKETQAQESIPVVPFLLSSETENQPSLFEFIFIQNNMKYRYGLRLNKTEVVDEWLFEAKKIKETLLFERHFQKIKVNPKFKEGLKLTEMTRKNALFLSVVAQFNGKIAESIIEWFSDLNIISGLGEYSPVTLKILEDSKLKDEFLNVFKIADFSIDDFRLKQRDISNAPKFIQKEIEKAKEAGIDLKLMPEIKTLHKKFNSQKELVELVEFDLEDMESKGTQNLFSLLGPILDTLSTGKVLIIDELESNLHPLITRFLVKLFHLKNNNSQFVFNTHDTNLLSNKFFRRDQIYFVNKNKYGQSSLYSLIDYDVRYDRIFDKDYLEGRYEAVPFIDNYSFWGNETCVKH